jgi:hypothetical protein
VIPCGGQTGGHQDGAHLVAVETHDVGLIVDPRPADVDTRGSFDRPFFFGVTVEADDRAQPAGDSCPRLAGVLQVAGEALDVDPADIEQAAAALQTPGGELAQIQRVGVAGVATIGGQEPGQRGQLGLRQRGFVPHDGGRRIGNGHDRNLLWSWPDDPDHNRSKRPGR